MGTLSKRPLRDFGVHAKRVEDFRTGASKKVDHPPQADVEPPRRWLRASTCFALAGASFVGALVLRAIGRNHLSLLVGQWVPTLLVIGLYADSSAVRAPAAAADRVR
jgi:hypothetical protein